MKSTVPSLQQSNNVATFKRSRKRNRQENVRSHLASPQTAIIYVTSKGAIGRPGILSTAATSAIIKAQLAIGCLIWPGSKGEGQSCPAELQDI